MPNLQHVGVLGMHWGIHRRQTHSDSSSIAPLKKKHVSELSNDDLKKAINRMQLEKQFKDLSSGGGSSRGKAFLSKLLINVGTKAVNSYVSSVNGDNQSYDYFAQKVRDAANNHKN